MTVICKKRPPILEEVEKLLLVYINEVQLRGDNVSESFVCEKALEIYDDLVKKNPETNRNICSKMITNIMRYHTANLLHHANNPQPVSTLFGLIRRV